MIVSMRSLSQNASTPTRAHRLVIETRSRDYPLRLKANRFQKGGRKERSDDPGGHGIETAREAIVCPSCSARASEVSEDRPSYVSTARGPPTFNVSGRVGRCDRTLREYRLRGCGRGRIRPLVETVSPWRRGRRFGNGRRRPTPCSAVHFVR